MRKFKLFYIAFVLFLSLTGCYADRGRLENNDLNAKNQQDRIVPSYTTIYEAIENGELGKAIALLQEALKGDKEVDLMQRDYRGDTLLHLAILAIHPSQERLGVEIINLLIRLNQDINVIDNEENTPLHIASYRGLFLIAENLVKNGANIYAENKGGEIPLHCAAQKGGIELVRLLIDWDKTASRIMKQLTIQEKDTELLTVSNSYIDKNNKNGLTPLYLAMHRRMLCGDYLVSDKLEKYLAVINLLVEAGANVNIKNENGMSLLHLASRKGYSELVSLLIKGRAEINSVDKYGWTPFHFAMDQYFANSHLEVAKLLIDGGASVNFKTKKSKTPLHIAAGNGFVEGMKFLCNYEIGLNLQAEDGSTPLHAVVKSVNKQAFLKVDERSYLEIQQGYLDILKSLIRRGADVNVKDKDNCTPLYYAVGEGAYDMVVYLIEKGADIDPMLLQAFSKCKTFDRSDEISKSSLIKIIKYLTKINKDVDINVQDSKGNTLLECAINSYGDYKLVLYLIEKGAKVNLAHSSLLHDVLFRLVSKKDKCVQVLEYLLQLGLDVNCTNEEGDTPLHIVMKKIADPSIRMINVYEYLIKIMNILMEKGARLDIKNNEGKGALDYLMSSNRRPLF